MYLWKNHYQFDNITGYKASKKQIGQSDKPIYFYIESYCIYSTRKLKKINASLSQKNQG